MIFVVVGGAGAMGRITIRDLYEFATSEDKIVIADYNLDRARELAEAYADPRVSAVFINVRKHAETAAAVQGAVAVVNCVQYQLNLDVMEAALAAGTHYIDLGGLFHMTRRQLELHERFRQAGLTALLGMGAAPGITNLLARVAADQMDSVREIHTKVAGKDLTKYKFTPALPVSYSLQTILEEFSFEPAVFTRGAFRFVTPMSGDEPHRFPPPVGVQRPMYTIHSEVATLPLSYQHKGVREVSFKIAFDAEFTDRVRFLRDLGLASHEPIEVGSVGVKPIELVNKVAMSQPAPQRVGKLKQHEIVRAVVKGTVQKSKVTWVLDCHTTGIAKWNLGTDVNTGCPPAIAARMLAAGEITERGAVPPEVAVPAEPFFRHLRQRGFRLVIAKKPGWTFPA